MRPIRIVPAGDAALVAVLGDRIDVELNRRAVALAGALGRRRPPLRDVVVGYASVTIYFDPLAEDVPALEAELRELDEAPQAEETPDGQLIEVPVAYGGVDGPDLEAVAARAGVSSREAAAIHAAVTYRVFMLGYLPGFAYMAATDPRLALPRRAAPRERVPAGSVAIAAGQTGIYPLEAPGGWHLIGRSPLRVYDPGRDEPCMFRPGDRVRFHAVSVA